MFKKVIYALIAFVIILVLVVLIKTLTFSYTSEKVEAVAPVKVPASAITHLQKAIQFPTISIEKGKVLDTVSFIDLTKFFEESYPLVDSLLKRESFGYSLLYKWKGKDENLAPVVLMGHMDVVPVDKTTLDQWKVPPFSGQILDDRIYGRGSLDDKMAVVALLEACELLLGSGFVPSRTIYFAFGHDEEVGGDYGAKQMVNYLQEQGVRPEFVLDEGGFIADGMLPGIKKPVAIINTAEKGYVSFKLSLQTEGGHSSNPPEKNTIGSLASAITKLEANQFDYHMIPLIEEQINRLGPEFDFTKKMAFANTWLFEKELLKGLNAHTTIAPTILEGGIKDNVIPTEASVVVNFRIMTGESVDSVKEHIIKTIDDDRIQLETVSNVNEPSRISDHKTPSFKLLEKTIKQLQGDVLVTPGLLGAGTDSKHFLSISENVYRFFPTKISPDNAKGFHGINEHVTIANYQETIQFCHQLMKNL